MSPNAETKLISKPLAEVLAGAATDAVLLAHFEELAGAASEEVPTVRPEPRDCLEYACGWCDACLADAHAYSARTLPASRSSL